MTCMSTMVLQTQVRYARRESKDINIFWHLPTTPAGLGTTLVT